MHVPALAPTKWGGCFSHEFYVPIQREKEKKEYIINELYGCSYCGGRDFSMCPLCAKTFLYCHIIMCGRDEFLNHVLLSQKMGHLLLSCFNVTSYFIIQEIYFSIIADDFCKD